MTSFKDILLPVRGSLRMIAEVRTNRQDDLLLRLGEMEGVALSVLTYEGDIVT